MTHRMRHAVESRPLCVRRGNYGCARCSNPYWTAGRSGRRPASLRETNTPKARDLEGPLAAAATIARPWQEGRGPDRSRNLHYLLDRSAAVVTACDDAVDVFRRSRLSWRLPAASPFPALVREVLFRSLPPQGTEDQRSTGGDHRVCCDRARALRRGGAGSDAEPLWPAPDFALPFAAHRARFRLW